MGKNSIKAQEGLLSNQPKWKQMEVEEAGLEFWQQKQNIQKIYDFLNLW